MIEYICIHALLTNKIEKYCQLGKITLYSFKNHCLVSFYAILYCHSFNMEGGRNAHPY